MDEKEKLLQNVQDLVDHEANEILVMGALFYKIENKLKNEIINDFKANINNLVTAYQLNELKYQSEISAMIRSYEEVVDQIANLYEIQYINIQDTLIKKQAAQKEAIAKIMEVKVLFEAFKAKDDKENLSKMKDIIKKRIEEKLNYDVLVDHCERKLERCLVNMQTSLKSIAVKKEVVLKNEKKTVISFFTNLIKKIFVRHNFDKEIKEQQDIFLKKVIKEGKDTEIYIGYKINQFNLQLEKAQEDINACAE